MGEKDAQILRSKMYATLTAFVLIITGYFGYQYLLPEVTTISEDLAYYGVLGEKVEADLNAEPLLAIDGDLKIQDTFKDGISITYGNTNSIQSEVESEKAESDGTTFATDDGVQKETLNLTFPEKLNTPMEITLPGGRIFTVTHNTNEEYKATLLSRSVLEESLSTLELETLNIKREQESTDQKQYIKYSSIDDRKHIYYAYQKDQAEGYRNLKNWTIYEHGFGFENESYTFTNTKLKINDRGEVEGRYYSQQDVQNEETRSQVDEDLWARAQRVLAEDLATDIENRPSDFSIPAPYILDRYGRMTTLEWKLDEDTSTIFVSFELDTYDYPVALDPTLMFTAPGVSNSATVIDGEGADDHFGHSLTTGDYNNDGRDDLAVGASYWNGDYTGRVYLFYGGSLSNANASAADVTLIGEAAGSYFGSSLTTGDFNADGIDDLAVGAYRWSNNFTGRTYIFYGGFLSDKNASAADVTFTGEATNNHLGYSLATGDYNNDGTDDLAVGAYYWNNNGTGRTYIFYGGTLTDKNASAADVTFTGETTSNYFGSSLTTGDFNHDGKDDLAVGARSYDVGSNTAEGRAYIFYGGTLTDKNASAADVTFTGETTNNYFGSALTTGDYNDDGTDDLAVGVAQYNSYQGRVYTFYGGSLTDKNASAADVTFTGEATSNSAFGSSLTTGDFNHDGKDDLAVGAYYYDISASTDEGRVYIFYGGVMVSKDADSADVIITGEEDDYFGSSLTIGDFNDDGKDDLAVGAYRYNSYQGRTYIFYSQSGQVNLNQTITGEGTGDYFGSAFAVGDFNSDGRDDLAVGAYKDNTNTGKVYIFYNDGEYTDLASTSDVVITGENTNDLFGASLTTGDLNNDGTDDLVIGAHGHDVGAGTNDGRAYIFYGGSMVDVNASAADVIITGEDTDNWFSRSFSVGDYNVDGVYDLAVGGPGWNGLDTGRVYIFYGGSLSSTINAGSADVILSGESSANGFGRSITTGDYDNDGVDDLAVGAEKWNADYVGRAYIFYGGALVSKNASAADITITGEKANDNFGWSVTTGDFNTDGRDDLVVGAHWYTSSSLRAGRVYVFYGDGTISTSAATADVTITGEAGSNYFGYSLTVGDFNNDGKNDLAVGAYGHNTSQGRAYLYHNSTFSSSMEAATSSSIIITGDSTNDNFGYALTTGDFNNDGKDDLVVGAPGYDNGGDTGRIYFNETRENYSWDIQRQDLSDGLRVDPLAGYEMKITGEDATGEFGTSFAFGDFNNDGKDDLVVGAPEYNSNQGKVYIFYNTGDYPTKAGSADVVIVGQGADDRFGTALTVGDLNADGKDDLVVGAHIYNSSQGRTYIFYGDSFTSKNASAADVILTGEATSNQFGRSLTTGDFNHDGTDDLVVGANAYNDSYQGRTYIFYGGSMLSENASAADVVLTGEATSNQFGRSLAAGDLNNDGIDDLVVGAWRYDTSYGRAYIFYGGSMVSENATGADITLTGESNLDYFGISLTIGDFNYDGVDDLTVSAHQYDSWHGRVYIFYGGSMVSENATGADVTLTGEAANNSFGNPLTTGDFNNDGKDDIAIGASGYDVSNNEGATYIFYNETLVGTTTYASSSITLYGETTSNSYGAALAAGDLNNDGQDDLVVGAIGYNSDQGRVYFYTFNDRVITGEGTDSYFGSALAVGDYNNDGKNDLAVGAYGYDDDNTGRVYIFYGGRKATTTAGSADVILTGEATNNSFGYSLTTGDFNADGKDDLAVGANQWNNNYTGRVYIFYGGSLSTPLDAGTDADVILTGEATNNSFGYSLTTGDFNADGIDDLAVGASNWNNGDGTGRTYIFYGGSLSTPLDAGTDADVILTGEATNNSFGYSLTTGDFNADGIDDLAVGASNWNNGDGTGRTYIFYGGSMVSEGAESADVILTGEATNNSFGRSLTTGDFNADGKDDLAVGAYYWNSNGTGRVYIFYGGSMVSEGAESADVIITGEGTWNYFGYSLATGDFNSDGKDDLAVGAYYWNSNGTGRVYIFYNDGHYTSEAQHADVIITGEAANSNFGQTLFASDLSGNGVDDLIIGAQGYDDPNDQGRVYILMSEAAAEHISHYKIRGTVKMRGTVIFH